MRDLDGRISTGMERESNERDILIEGAFVGLGKNPTPGKLQGIQKDDHC